MYMVLEMTKFSKLLASIMGVRFVIVTLRDIDISSQKAKPTQKLTDPILSLSVPAARVIDFVNKQDTIERVIYTVGNNMPDLIFTKYSCEYIYDLSSGDLLELIIHGKVGL